MDKRGNDQECRNHNRQEDQPIGVAIVEREPIARNLGARDRLVGELAERVARRVIRDAR